MFDFIIEDGTGLQNSTAYCDVPFVDDYAEFHESSDWDELFIEDKEKHIIRATMFLDEMLVYQGTLLNPDQSLNWPRTRFTDSNGRSIEGLPDIIIRATAQLAVKSAEGVLMDTSPVLTSRAWGGASESYLGGFQEEESTVDMVKNMLSRLGYGRSTTSFVTARRA